MNFLHSLFSKAQKGDVSPPSVEDMEQAKKIFFEYSCNHYYMSREGIDFKNYHISKEQEIEWRNEFIAYWVSKLSVDDLAAVHRLEGANAIESVPDLIDIANKGDSYVKLWVASAIWSVSFRNDIDTKLQKQTLDIAIKLLESIVESQVQLSENHRKEIPAIGMKNLGASTPEEYIVNFAQRKLKEAKK
jgi:hypothetical protein